MMSHPQCWPRAPTGKIRPWACVCMYVCMYVVVFLLCFSSVVVLNKTDSTHKWTSGTASERARSINRRPIACGAVRSFGTQWISPRRVVWSRPMFTRGRRQKSIGDKCNALQWSTAALYQLVYCCAV